MAKKRVGGHRGRTNANGKAYSARHIDRNFQLENAEHIDERLTAQNKIWKYEVDLDTGQEQTLDEYEQALYQKYFSTALDKRNEKQIANRHKDRVQTMEQFRRNAKACPEEVIWTIGKAGDTVDVEILEECFNEYVEWHKTHFPNVIFIDAGLHLDEPDAAPHIHQRQVWFATHDESGEEYLRVHQNDALAEMKIERPDPSKEESRFNNAKITYTAMCHEKMIEIAEAHGIEIEREPDEKSKSGLSLLEYKVRTTKEKLAEAEEQLDNLKSKKAQLEKANDDFVRDLEPTPTKTVKKFGGEKEVPKTAEELQRDREVKAAQAVLEREEALAEKERSIADKERQLERERTELEADTQAMTEYLAEQQTALKTQAAATEQRLETAYKQKEQSIIARFEQKIAVLTQKLKAVTDALFASIVQKEVDKLVQIPVPTAAEVLVRNQQQIKQQTQQTKGADEWQR